MMRVLTILFLTSSQFLYSQILENCSTCNSTLIQNKQLEDKSLEELQLLRNEILARKGYVFSSDLYWRYFEDQPWYKPDSSNEKIDLNAIEKQNVELIKNLEAKEKSKRETSISDLKALKKGLNDNDEKVISKYLSKLKSDGYYKSLIAELKFTLNKIDLSDIHWNRKSGLYKVSVDNGYSISSYEILFQDGQIKIQCGMNSHSSIFGEFFDGYSDYMSENESQTWFVFNQTDSGIVFDFWTGAG